MPNQPTQWCVHQLPELPKTFVLVLVDAREVEVHGLGRTPTHKTPHEPTYKPTYKSTLSIFAGAALFVAIRASFRAEPLRRRRAF